MCRLAAYVGPPTPVSALVYDPPHSLSAQASAPREMHFSRINVDGTGVAWWNADHPEPLRYRSDRPPWADANLPSLARRLTAGTQLAAVRAATAGIPHGTTFVHPFVHGTLAGTHNGWIGAFRERTARPLLATLPDHLFAAFDGLSDSLLLFLLAVARLERDPAGGLAGAVGHAVAFVAAECERQGAAAALNLAIAGPSEVVVARMSHEAPTNTLYTLRDGERWPGAGLVASEPLDEDPGWTPVPDGTLVRLSAGGVESLPLPGLSPAPDALAPAAADATHDL